MTATPRDLTRTQFVARMHARGFQSAGGVLGYWKLPGLHTEISELNGGARLRDRLAYMLREVDRYTRKAGAS